MSSPVFSIGSSPAELVKREREIAGKIARLPPSKERDDLSEELLQVRRLLELLGYKCLG